MEMVTCLPARLPGGSEPLRQGLSGVDLALQERVHRAQQKRSLPPKSRKFFLSPPVKQGYKSMK